MFLYFLLYSYSFTYFYVFLDLNMINYPTLYSRDTHNNIRIWYMQQDGEKYRTISGLQDGEKVITKWTITEGKNLNKTNETSPIEQAEKEINAKYNDQKSTGYHDSIDNIDEIQYVKPMLACKYEDEKDKIDWANGVYVSPKMDGLRSIISKNGATSRNGKKFVSFPHITRELQLLFDKLPNFVADGEVYSDRLSDNFEKIISLARKTKPTAEDLVESEQFIQYWIFDSPILEGGFHKRYTQLVDIFDKHFKNNKWIKLCEHKLISTKFDIEDNLELYIQDGFEGLMVNTYNGKYENKRSKNLLKYKLFQDCEAKIIDIIEGSGNRSGMFGYAKLQMNNGNIFDSNARGNEKYYIELLQNKSKYIGKLATVRFQNLTTKEQVPRFPVIVAIRNYE